MLNSAKAEATLRSACTGTPGAPKPEIRNCLLASDGAMSSFSLRSSTPSATLSGPPLSFISSREAFRSMLATEVLLTLKRPL